MEKNPTCLWMDQGTVTFVLKNSDECIFFVVGWYMYKIKLSGVGGDGSVLGSLSLLKLTDVEFIY